MSASGGAGGGPAAPVARQPGAPRFCGTAGARVLGGLIGLAALAMFAVGWKHLRSEIARPAWPEYALAALVLGLLMWAVRRVALARRPGERAFLLIALAVFVVSRLVALRLVPAEPVSDFRSYLSLARLLATGEPLPPSESHRLFIAWGYPLALAGWMRAFGPSLGAARLFNVVLGAWAGVLLHGLARAVAGRRVARAAVVLYILWPAQFFMTPVLASEHLALPLALAALRAVVDARRRTGRLRASLGGLWLGLAFAVRPALGVLLPGGMLLVVRRRRGARANLVLCGLVLGGFAASQAGYRGLLQGVYGRTPPGVAWWNLMVGLNVGARGQWNDADARAFGSYRSLSEANAFARREIRRRLVEPASTLAQLARRKLQILWGDAFYGVYWSTRPRVAPTVATAPAASAADGPARETRRLYAWSQFYHLALMALCASGGLRAAARGTAREATLAALLIASGSAVHAVFETQSRYSYVFSVGVLLLAAGGLCAVGRARRARVSGAPAADPPPPVRSADRAPGPRGTP